RTAAGGESAGVAAAAAMVGTLRWCLAAAAALTVPAAMVAAVIMLAAKMVVVTGMAVRVVVLAVGDRRSSEVAGKVAAVHGERPPFGGDCKIHVKYRSFHRIRAKARKEIKPVSDVTTAMTAILKQFQATPPPASVKAVEDIYLTCGGAHPYYQCLAADGNTFLKFQDNIQGYVSAAAVNYNQKMFKQLHINITLADALILILKYQKMLKALLSNKKKLLELENTPLNENCSAVILKKLPEKLGDPGKFLISCSFSELKCKALADLGASINLMPLSVWKKLGLPELISTRMTLELANREICTPAGIARYVFVLVEKFTFRADFVIVDYGSDPRVPFILGRHFLWTARALIDVHGEEMILHDGDERLTLNMRHDTSSYSNQPQKESINMINIYDDSLRIILKICLQQIIILAIPLFLLIPI
nr:reverse transcriptase domain-containing protein [Tanacetum cinerariifolium]